MLGEYFRGWEEGEMERVGSVRVNWVFLRTVDVLLTSKMGCFIISYKYILTFFRFFLTNIFIYLNFI